MPPDNPSPLFWFPFPIDRWLGDLAGGLRADQKGALLDLLATAWTQEPPCTLPADPTYLASRSGLGATWRKLSLPLMKHFEPTDNDRVICPWLRTIYDEQLTKYENRSRANRANRRGTKGRTIAPTIEPTIVMTNEPTNEATSPPTIDPVIPVTDGDTNGERFEPQNLELRGASPSALTSTGREAPALDRALGAETPRAASTGPDVHSEATRRHELAYFRRLTERVESFALAHPARYEEVVAKIRLGLALPRGKPIPAWYKQQFDEMVLVAVREMHPDWPQSADDWHPEVGESDGEGVAA